MPNEIIHNSQIGDHETINVIVAITPLLNLYLEKLIEDFDSNYVIFEYSSRKLINNRNLNIVDATYHSGLEHVSVLRMMKRKLNQYNKKFKVNFFFIMG